MKPIVFHPSASKETHDAALHFETIRAGLGVDFGAELSAALTRIQGNPQLYAAGSGTIRVCPLQRFSYAVFYEELSDKIWVAAVGHNGRRPRYWARRRP